MTPSNNPYLAHGVCEILAAVDAARQMRPDLPEDLATVYLRQGKTAAQAEADLFNRVNGPPVGRALAKASMIAELKRMGMAPDGEASGPNAQPVRGSPAGQKAASEMAKASMLAEMKRMGMAPDGEASGPNAQPVRGSPAGQKAASEMAKASMLAEMKRMGITPLE